MRFNSVNAYPPGGLYFFEYEGEHVQSTSRPQIESMVKALFEKHGKEAPFAPFDLVMAHMCPSMPSGFCDGAPTPRIQIAQVKENTRKLFGKKVAPPVVIRERLHVCLGCKENTKTVCPECCGLLDWVLKGLGNRTKLPADNFAFVCRPAQTFVSALVSVESPGEIPEGCPATCWRHLEHKPK